MKAQSSHHSIKEDPFINPVWHALHTTHARFVLRTAGVCKYPADVAPFAAIARNDEDSLRQLHSITRTGEGVSLIGDRPPAVEGFLHVESLAGLQMVYPYGRPPQKSAAIQDVMQLTDADAPAMVELTDLAFPGYFRKRTCEMGTYYGVRSGGQLIAMAGERICFARNREVSGVCTHPAHTGKGLAGTLILRLMQDHFQHGLHSYLHVSAANARAIALYDRLGFSVQREVTFHRIRRTD